MWYFRKFDELELYDLEQIFRLRQSIFIIEQMSFFEDIDGYDPEAIHIFYKENEKIYSYCRILDLRDKIILGRVTVQNDKRANGLGRELLLNSLEYLNKNYRDKDVHIVAMSYLKKFYESLGFESISDEYIMDNHPHEDMIIKR